MASPGALRRRASSRADCTGGGSPDSGVVAVGPDGPGTGLRDGLGDEVLVRVGRVFTVGDKVGLAIGMGLRSADETGEGVGKTVGMPVG
jgi:hypothetical protein